MVHHCGLYLHLLTRLSIFSYIYSSDISLVAWKTYLCFFTYFLKNTELSFKSDKWVPFFFNAHWESPWPHAFDKTCFCRSILPDLLLSVCGSMFFWLLLYVCRLTYLPVFITRLVSVTVALPESVCIFWTQAGLWSASLAPQWSSCLGNSWVLLVIGPLIFKISCEKPSGA